ncbi:MAG: toxin glutamine deamidase domain-containing protein [Acidimicrobiales bacterium]
MDRPWDDQQGASDAAPDTPRPEGTVPGASRGDLLTDARTRQESALAYRARVDEVYAKAALHAPVLRAGDDQSPDTTEAERPNIADKHPTRYTRSADPPPRVEGPGEHPTRWLADIYPGRERNERPNNCGECARAVDNTWHGLPAAAAELANRKVGGERPAVMNEWAGESPEPASMAAIGQRLRELGPGSSAVVGFDRKDAPGHWFNAVNHEGTVLAVDGQVARFEDWPPSKAGLGFDESGMSYSDAIYFTADGKVARNDHQ